MRPVYKNRLILFLVFISLTLIVSSARLADLQLLRGDAYRRQAERSLERVELLAGQRGRILDRNGVILAEDEPCYDLCMDYRLLSDNSRWRDRQIRRILKTNKWTRKNPDDVATAETLLEKRIDYTWSLARQIAAERGMDIDRSARRVRNSIERQRKAVGHEIREERMHHVVVDGLDEATGLALADMMAETIGAKLRPSHRRRYPSGDVAAHIIGITTPVFREDIERHNLKSTQANWLERVQNNYFPGDTIGKMGVERAAEKTLRGRRGYRRRRGDGTVIEEILPLDGEDVTLAIDIRLQGALTDLLRRSDARAKGDQTGAIVIMDVDSRDVLAMVSWPTYDLNTYRRNYNELITAHARLPLLHRAVASMAAPGSTVKPITALAGLSSGKITADTLMYCPGYMYLTRSGKKLLKDHAIGEMAVAEAIQRSSNVFMARIGQRVGLRYLTAWMGRFGFGMSPQTGLPNERAGVLGTPTYLRTKLRRSPLRGDSWFISIGQGVFSASPLQVANAHATVASGGKFLTPRVLLTHGPKQQGYQIPITAEHVAVVHDGMDWVINRRRGTAYRYWQLGTPLGVTVCGKTGTAQVPPMRVDSNKNGRIDSKDQIVRQGDHAWFAGFAPKTRPRLAFAVLNEYAGGGGANAAPLAKEALRICEQFGLLGGNP
jgi:penicillin-binding protein 2